jgi:hypothetical protein
LAGFSAPTGISKTVPYIALMETAAAGKAAAQSAHVSGKRET